MKILVTGGAGFIGSHLVDSLVAKGHEVLVVDDLSAGKEEYINTKARFEKIDIRDKTLDTVVQNFGPEVIYHLAAQKNVRKSIEDPQYDADINIMGALNVLQSAKKHKVKKFIFTSSCGIYGDADNFPTKEDTLLQPPSPYLLNKLTFEKYLSILAGEDLKYLVFRPANVYGPRQDPHGEAGVISLLFDSAINKKGFNIFGDGKTTRDYVYVGDLVDAFVRALEGVEGVFNIGTSQETNLLDLLEQVKKASGQDIDVKHIEAVSGEVQRSCLDISAAKDKLDWQPKINLEKGLDLTYKWFNEK